MSDFEILDVISTKGKKNNIRIYRARARDVKSSDICLKTFTSPKFSLVQEALNEAKLLLIASAQHQNICQMQDCFIEQDKDLFKFGIVMEYFPDGDLEDEIKRRKRKKMHWTDLEFNEISDGLIDSLSVLQSNKICHRDLKPQNIFMSGPKIYKIGDFGLSKKDSFGVSCTRTLVGTPIYFSPILAQRYLEYQMNGGETSVHCNMYKNDVFSLGLTFLRMASLQSIRGINTKGQDHIVQRIDSLKYSDAIRGMLFHMLQVNECDRPDFLTLRIIVKELNKVILPIQPDFIPVLIEETSEISTFSVQVTPIIEPEIIEEHKKPEEDENEFCDMETVVSETEIFDDIDFDEEDFEEIKVEIGDFSELSLQDCIMTVDEKVLLICGEDRKSINRIGGECLRKTEKVESRIFLSGDSSDSLI